MHDNTILKMTSISKAFTGVQALSEVDFQLKSGEVHVLIGENGAGKSTLMKILSGIYEKDEGEIEVEGKVVDIEDVHQAQELGISIIHQELNMMMQRTVAQNIYLGREPMKSKLLGWIDIKKMMKESEKLLKKMDMDVAPDAVVKELSIAQQQMIEVIKALSIDAKILVMDEPTSSLTHKEIESLFHVVEALKAQGLGIIYISHRMEEIFRIGDRVTVLRDGRYIGTRELKDTSMDDLVTMMVGRSIENMFGRKVHPIGKEMLRTENLSGLRFRNVSINLHEGEIVGLAGLIGAGRTELVKAIFGYDPIESGKLFLEGVEVKKHSTQDSVKAGLAFLSEDRKTEGLVLDMPIKQNISQASLDQLFPTGIMDFKKEEKVAEEYRKDLNIATSDVSKLVGALSGGNQQKVALGKWLCTGRKTIIFDEPTRGIDVGAKHDIYELMDRLAGEGYAILVISSDQLELIGLSDRAYVMCDGEVVADLDKEHLTADTIVAYAIGGKGGSDQ